MTPTRIRDVVPDAIYTAAEAAAFLRVGSLRTLYAWVRSGRLNRVPHRPGRPAFWGSELLRAVGERDGGEATETPAQRKVRGERYRREMMTA